MTEENPASWSEGGSHTAEQDRRLLAALSNDTEGVVSPTDLVVSEKSGTPDMSVDVAGGRAFILGTEATYQGTYFVENRGVENLVIAASDPTNPRKDLVVAEVPYTTYPGSASDWRLYVVTGTAAASPSDPAIPDNSLVLARVNVAASASSIVDANIDDLRVPWLPASLSNAAAVNAYSAIFTGQAIWSASEGRRWIYDGSNWLIVGGHMPEFSLRSTSAQSIATATESALNGFSGAQVDSDSFSTSGTVLTIPTGLGGEYELAVGVTFASNATGVRYVKVTGTGFSSSSPIAAGDLLCLNPAASGGFGTILDGHFKLRLPAGATLSVEVYQNSGGNLNVTAKSVHLKMIDHIPALT